MEESFKERMYCRPRPGVKLMGVRGSGLCRITYINWERERVHVDTMTGIGMTLDMEDIERLDKPNISEEIKLLVEFFNTQEMRPALAHYIKDDISTLLHWLIPDKAPQVMENLDVVATSLGFDLEFVKDFNITEEGKYRGIHDAIKAGINHRKTTTGLQTLSAYITDNKLPWTSTTDRGTGIRDVKVSLDSRLSEKKVAEAYNLHDFKVLGRSGTTYLTLRERTQEQIQYKRDNPDMNINN